MNGTLESIPVQPPASDAPGEVERSPAGDGDLAAENARLRRALDIAESRYQLLVAASFEGLAVTEDGRLVDVNDAYAAMLGYDRAELIGRLAWEFAAPESRAAIEEHIFGGSSEPYETVGLRKDGKPISLEVRGKTIEVGERRLRVAALRDISERKQIDAHVRALYEEAQEQTRIHVELNAALRETAEARDCALQELQVERQRLREAFLQAPAIICVLEGPDHHIVLANAAFFSVVGLRDVTGKRIRDIFPPDDFEGLADTLDQVYATGRRYVGNGITSPPLPGYGADRRILDIVCQPTRDPAGQVNGIFVHAVDVTARTRARARAEALAAERTAILAQVIEGVIVADATGRITFVNEQARRLHGVAELGVPIERYSETYHLFRLDGTPYPPEELPLARAVLYGETVRHASWRIRHPDGTEIVVEGSATPVFAGSGSRIGSVLILREVAA